MLRCSQSTLRILSSNTRNAETSLPRVLHLQTKNSVADNGTRRNTLTRSKLTRNEDQQLNLSETSIDAHDTQAHQNVETDSRPLMNGEVDAGRLSRAGIRKARVGRMPAKSVPLAINTPVFKNGNPAAELREQISLVVWGSLPCDKTVMDNLMRLYRIARQEPVGTGFSSQDLDDLVSICGTLSLAHAPPCSFHVTLVRGTDGIPKEEQRLYWDFILEVQNDRVKLLGLDDSPASTYWRMHANIFRAQDGKSIGKPGVVDALNQIGSAYLNIRHRSREPHVHLSYFQTAFSTYSTPAHKNHVAASFCDFLGSERNLVTPEYVHVFWKLVLELGGNFPTVLQARLVDVVSSRVAAFRPKIPRIPDPTSTMPNPGTSLNSFFAACVFECLLNSKIPMFAIPWFSRVAKRSFRKDLSLPTRWSNLTLLAATMIPGGSHPTIAQLDECPQSRTFRTLLSISWVQNMLREIDFPAKEVAAIQEGLRSVTQQLWQNWQSAVPGAGRIQVVIMPSFLQIAGWTRDDALLQRSFRYGRDQCFELLQGPPTPGKTEALDMVATYCTSLARCRNYQWEAIFQHVDSIVPEQVSRTLLVTRITDHLVRYDSEQVKPFLNFLVTRGLSPSIDTSLKAAIALVQRQQWNMALEYLSSPQFDRLQRERLAISFLRVFQERRVENVNPSLAISLADTLLCLYGDSPPSLYARYPIRYFLKPLIEAGHGSKAVDIVSKIVLHHSAFFTQRCIRRYLIQLVHRHQPPQAVRLMLLTQDHFTLPGKLDLNRKLASALHDVGATSRVRRIFEGNEKVVSFRTARERMLRTIVMRSPCKARLSSLRVMSILKKVDQTSLSYAPAIRSAISFLVKNGRIFAARSLFGRVSKSMNPKARNVLGNVILHGCFLKHASRGRLWRDLLHTRDALARRYQFTSDRATTNILAKYFLGRRSTADSLQIRALFDDFIRHGYPGAQRWINNKNLPFGSSPSFTSPLSDLIDNTQPISFSKHVQPLYNMFISALQLRNDRSAAKVVVAILKEARYNDAREKEKRNQARREGIIRKRAKQNMFPPL